MANRETIEKVNSELQRGDKSIITQSTGLSKLTINRFFNGKEDRLIEDTHTRIMNAALKLIEDRQNRARDLANKTNNLLGQP
jgi:DNA-binding LacI/PurR family transcriptional regulator